MRIKCELIPQKWDGKAYLNRRDGARRLTEIGCDAYDGGIYPEKRHVIDAIGIM